MGIKRKAPKIKGTTRVSFGDRQLIKRLWIADKNSKQAKQTRTREINRSDKERLDRAPSRKASDAFQVFAKKARVGSNAFVYVDGDDRAAVRAMCDPEWDALVNRCERLASFERWMDDLSSTLAHGDADDAAGELVIAAKRASGMPASDDVPLLTGKKHKRSINFRARERRHMELLRATSTADVGSTVRKRRRATMGAEDDDEEGDDRVPKRPKRGTSRVESDDDDCDGDDDVMMTSSVEEQGGTVERDQLDAFHSSRNVCDPVPRVGFEVDASVWYYCHTCGDPVKSDDMVSIPNGAVDVLFLHEACDARRRAALRRAVERKSLLAGEPFQ